ncbi:NOP16 [Sanghuangporus weigelae]
MANPRQRRKARSSSHKPVKQSRRANKLLKKQSPIKGPKALQDAWDKRKTVRQNYAALGSAHTLNPTDSGGRDMSRSASAVSHRITDARPEEDKAELAKEKRTAGNETSTNTLRDQKKDGKLPRGFGRIIRDDSGTIVDIVLAEEEMPDCEEVAKDKDFEIGTSSGQTEKLVDPPNSRWLLVDRGREGDPENEDVKELLEALEAASKAGAERTRTTSVGEMKYLTRLVETYGTDYDAISLDRKRNMNQYSAGQLKRAIERAKAREN